MATFGQMLARFKASQKLAEKLDKASLGMAASEEKRELESARSDYETAVEEAERQMKKKARKRSVRSFLGGTALTALGVATGQPKLLTTAMGAVGNYAGASSVPSYNKYIESNLGRGLFYNQAKIDLNRDIAATNQFIQDAGDSQSLANTINAVSFGAQAYMGYDTLLGLKSDFKDLMRGLGGNSPLYDGIDTETPVDTGDVMSPANILSTPGSVGV